MIYAFVCLLAALSGLTLSAQCPVRAGLPERKVAKDLVVKRFQPQLDGRIIRAGSKQLEIGKGGVLTLSASGECLFSSGGPCCRIDSGGQTIWPSMSNKFSEDGGSVTNDGNAFVFSDRKSTRLNSSHQI